MLGAFQAGCTTLPDAGKDDGGVSAGGEASGGTAGSRSRGGAGNALPGGAATDGGSIPTSSSGGIGGATSTGGNGTTRGTAGAATSGGAAGDADAGNDPDGKDAGVPIAHDFFSTVSIEESDSVNLSSDGDLWANCWADDGALYVANGDGKGFGLVTSDIVVSRVDGTPNGTSDPLRGTPLAAGDAVASVWSGASYNRKPTSMLCSGGDLYVAVEDLRTLTFDDAPAATIVRSSDKGKTWTWDRAAPMFSEHVFTTVLFLDFGKDGEHAPAGFVYAYGLDDNWAFNSSLAPPTALYLARIPRDAIQDRTKWEFFGGLDSAGAPRWMSDIAGREPVLEDTRRLFATPLDPTLMFKNMTPLSQGGIVYDAPLHRYIYSSWTEYTFELYEAPEPWGPWTHFYSKDYGVFPWTDTKNGGYALTVPSKFISADGTSLWIQSNAWGNGAQNYDFSLRKLLLAPYTPSEPHNARGATPLSTPAEGAVPLTTSLHDGRVAILNDGVTSNQSEDSWDGDSKDLDVWGYTFPHAVRVDELRYTTGAQSKEGGAFTRIGVEVRHGKVWEPVTGLRTTPAYPLSGTAPASTTYTFQFDETVCDGIRVAGKPGGSSHFTSIAELGVYLE
jgi:hypothetical protein